MDTELKQETGRIWIHTYNDKSRGLVDAHDVRCAGCTPYVPAKELDRVRRETWGAALNALRLLQESTVTNGGKSHRDRERARRQAIYVRGLDDARGALERARDESEKELWLILL